MVDACKLLAVDLMAGHWEFTLGHQRVQEIVEKDFKGKIEFLAQNIKTPTSATRSSHPIHARDERVKVAVIGQAFPTRRSPTRAGWCRTGPSHPGREHAEGRQRSEAKGAQVVVVLSHNGMDVDLKMASRVTASTPSWAATPRRRTAATQVRNAKGVTLVTNAGSNGKFLACSIST